MSTKEQYWKYSLIVIILFMGVIIFRQITPFLGGLLGALTIYILVRGQMNHLVEKRKLKRSISALLITAETIFVFLIPLGLTVWMVANKLQDINLDPQTYIAPIQQVAEFIKEKTGYDVLGKDTLSFIMSILPRIGQIIMESISSLAINLFVMIFVLYFMLIGGKKMEAYVNDILPFNEANTQEVIHDNMIVPFQCYRYSLTGYHPGRRGYDRLSAFRSTEHTDAGIPDLLCNHHSDGRYGIGMVSCSRLSCHQRRLVQRHRAFWLWGYRRIAIGQSHPVHPSKEDGGYASAYHYFWSSHRSADIRVYGSHLRSVAAFIILSFCGYVQERISRLAK